MDLDVFVMEMRNLRDRLMPMLREWEEAHPEPEADPEAEAAKPPAETTTPENVEKAGAEQQAV